MDTLFQDVRFALRTHSRQPGFTAIVLLTLALGIGANTAIFTVVNAVVLQPLPFDNAGQLVRVTADAEGLGSSDIGMSPPELFDYRDSTGLFEGIAGLYPINANLTEVDEPERVEVLLVSPEYFSILGVRPALGRVFSKAEDDHPGIAEVVVISDAIWARRFGRAPDVLGRTLRIDDDSFKIVGVMPPSFRHPGRTLRGDVEMWAPAGYRSDPFPPPGRRGYFLAGSIARLKPGITVNDAQQRLNAFAEQTRAAYPTDYPASARWTPKIIPLHEDVVGNVRPALVMLLAAVGLVLLIGCANIAGLVLARASSRQRELAVRRALGSGRFRIARLLLTESIVLAIAGGALGLIVAFWGVDALLALMPSELPRINEVHIGVRVIAFTALASIGTGILFGLAPAIQFSHSEIVGSLKDARSSSSRSRQALRGALVVTEFALATVLLVAAVLLVRSFRAVQQVDPGFKSQGVLTARVWLPRPNDPARGKYLAHPPRLALFEDILRRLQQQPGVEQAAIFQNLPLDGQRGSFTVTVDGQPADTTGSVPTVQGNFASQDFFSVLRIPLLDGRVFSAEDRPAGAPVVVVNQEMARRYFSGSAVGQRVKFGGAASKSPWMTVVGVVGNVLNERLEGSPGPMLYRPMAQATNLSFGVAVRTSADPRSLTQAVVSAIRAADPNVPAFAVRTMDDVLASATASRRFSTQLLGAFALLALFLAAIGIYGVMSYLVHQRTREIGIRMALGARPRAVVRMIAAHALRLAVVGTTAGAIAALLLLPLLALPATGLLFSVRATDPATLAVVAGLLIGTAVAATAIPARRASRVDPVIALRAD
ncbi:MAG TPA: ABC transporter permease [Vicinamibacterales bacterium]|jgi:predicted permease|nr:ABC transporter permease [Vicinamibacterales bacterium]